jgi:hypothetical protein
MDANVIEIRKLENKFSGLEIHHVIRDNNVGADVLSKLGSDRASVPPEVFVTSCITLPLGHQTQVPLFRVPRNPTERS